MTIKRISKSSTDGQHDNLEPLPDPPRIPDMQQNKHIIRADQALETWFRNRPGVLVNGQGYLCPDRRNVRRCPVPDCVVAFGVDPERIVANNGYVISEVGKPPEFVLEVASKSTRRRDYTDKRAQYASMGVGEYWRFDHTGGRYHDAALAGDRLADRAYERMDVTTESDGLIWGYSAALGLELCWRNGQLLFRNPATGEFLLSHSQTQDALETAEARARQEQTARQDAEARARQEQTARQDAEARLRQIEAKLRRRQEGE